MSNPREDPIVGGLAIRPVRINNHVAREALARQYPPQGVARPLTADPDTFGDLLSPFAQPVVPLNPGLNDEGNRVGVRIFNYQVYTGAAGNVNVASVAVQPNTVHRLMGAYCYHNDVAAHVMRLTVRVGATDYAYLAYQAGVGAQVPVIATNLPMWLAYGPGTVAVNATADAMGGGAQITLVTMYLELPDSGLLWTL